MTDKETSGADFRKCLKLVDAKQPGLILGLY